jgi:hypothetical protein
MMCCFPVQIAVNSNKGDVIMLGLGPCMPFLLASPGIAYAEAVDEPEGLVVALMNSETVKLSIAYVVGIVGYIVASGALMGYFARNFDAVSGRTAPKAATPIEAH